MITRIAGIVLRAKDKHLTARFYEKLGLVSHEHEHGGPKHYEITPLSTDYVVEVYQRSETFSGDAIMLEVASIETALSQITEFGIKLKSAIKNVPEMRFVYVSDPDGRNVMLIEKK